MTTKDLQSLDDIEAEHIASAARIFPLERKIRWIVTRTDLDGLWLLHVREFDARIRHVAMQPHRMQIYWELPWDAGCGPLTLRRCTLHHEDVWRTVGRTVWAAVSLPIEQTHTLSEIAGEDLSAPDTAQLVTPPLRCSDQFAALHHQILTEQAVEPEVQRALRMQMIQRLIECLVTGDIRPASWAFRAHADIMRRFHRYAEEQGDDRPVYVPELCQAIGVPERTLRYCCEQELGISPRAYLTLRRLTSVRRALLRGAASVTDAARQYGFWHLGRFAQAYRVQFGELPSTTIKAQRQPRTEI